MKITSCFIIIFTFIFFQQNYSQQNLNDKLIEFRFAETKSDSGLTEYEMINSGQRFYLHSEILFSEADIDSAYLTGITNEIGIVLKFNEEASSKFAEITARNISKRIGILYEGKLLTTPVIRIKITSGTVQINGKFSKTEAAKIVKSLSSGSSND